MGLQIGEKAETDLYFWWFLKKMVSAPWPPIEWPVSEALPVSKFGKVVCKYDGSSSVMYSYMRHFFHFGIVAFT